MTRGPSPGGQDSPTSGTVGRAAAGDRCGVGTHHALDGARFAEELRAGLRAEWADPVRWLLGDPATEDVRPHRLGLAAGEGRAAGGAAGRVRQAFFFFQNLRHFHAFLKTFKT